MCETLSPPKGKQTGEYKLDAAQKKWQNKIWKLGG